jgi:UDP-glucose 4-epimerase
VKLLITGGFGYLGSRLAQYFASQGGYDIVLGSRASQDVPEWSPQARVVNIPWDSAGGLDDACAGVDVIIQAAGLNAQACYSDPVAALEFNGAATGRLLQTAIRQKVRRFIYVSTAHVYSSPLEGRITEESCPASLHPYATSHRAAEDLVRHAQQRELIEGIVVRLSNAFGAPAHKDANCWMLLVNDLCRQAVQTRKLELRSSGLQQRDFITLEDVACAAGHLIGLTREQYGDGLFNLGGASLSVWEMTQRIAARCRAVLGFSPEIVRPEPALNERIASLHYDCTKLRKTGFRLTGVMDNELDNTLLMCSQTWGQKAR